MIGLINFALCIKLIVDLAKILSRALEKPISDLRPLSVFPVNELEVFRWDTLLTKEPETIVWLSNMDSQSVFIDIGANVGIYSLVSLCLGIKKVYSFEPSPLNFSSLSNTIFSNSLEIYADAFCCGISTAPSIIYFSHSNEFKSGQAEFTQTSDCQLNSFPIIALPISFFLDNNSLNNVSHLKIDVDGPELDVLTSCIPILKSSSLKSALIECTHAVSDQPVCSLMKKYGFVVDKSYEDLPTHSTQRRLNEDINVRNIVFTR